MYTVLAFYIKPRGVPKILAHWGPPLVLRHRWPITNMGSAGTFWKLAWLVPATTSDHLTNVTWRPTVLEKWVNVFSQLKTRNSTVA